MSFNKLSDQTMYTQIMRIHSFLFLDYCLLAVSQLLIKFQQTYYFLPHTNLRRNNIQEEKQWD